MIEWLKAHEELLLWLATSLLPVLIGGRNPVSLAVMSRPRRTLIRIASAISIDWREVRLALKDDPLVATTTTVTVSTFPPAPRVPTIPHLPVDTDVPVTLDVPTQRPQKGPST